MEVRPGWSSGVWPAAHVLDLVGHAQRVLTRRADPRDGRIRVEPTFPQETGRGHARPVQPGASGDGHGLALSHAVRQVGDGPAIGAVVIGRHGIGHRVPQ